MQLEHILQAHGLIGRGKGGEGIILPEITNFTGGSNTQGTNVTLSWTNPSIIEFTKTQIFVSNTDITNLDYDTLLADGTKIVDGDIESFIVEGLTHNDVRYFKAFTIINTLGEVKASRGINLIVTAKDIQAPGKVTSVIIKEDNNKLDVTLTNPTDSDFSMIIVRYGTALIDDENSGVLGYEGSSESFSITGLTNDTEYYIRIFTVDTAGNINRSTNMQYTAIPSDGDDKTGSPGSKVLIAGDMTAGYFGVVPASELFTGAEISSACGITAGTLQFNTDGWLKFAIDGKIVFKSQKPYRHTISWDNINAVGAVLGTKTVTKGGHTYKARLMKGGNGDATNAAIGPKGSEWNKLMLPIHIKAKDQSWAYPANVDVPTAYWGIDFTDADLMTHRDHGNGTYQWCQETFHSNAARRVIRGYGGVSRSYNTTSSLAYANGGWSPCLEWVS